MLKNKFPGMIYLQDNVQTLIQRASSNPSKNNAKQEKIQTAK